MKTWVIYVAAGLGGLLGFLIDGIITGGVVGAGLWFGLTALDKYLDKGPGPGPDAYA